MQILELGWPTTTTPIQLDCFDKTVSKLTNSTEHTYILADKIGPDVCSRFRFQFDLIFIYLLCTQKIKRKKETARTATMCYYLISIVFFYLHVSCARFARYMRLYSSEVFYYILSLSHTHIHPT